MKVVIDVKCLKEKCIHHDVCALYTFSGYASDECGFYETKPHVENEKQQWIPCTDRLPDEHGYYLVTTDGSHNDVIDIAEYGKFFRKPEYDCVWEWNKASKVIAWMRLPEPYKKEGD